MKRECDIILLSYESPDLLKRCVESVFRHTHVPSRIIIVDNASRDPEVARFIQSLKGNDTISVEKVFGDENAGFAGGMNKGMKISDSPYMCLLNNDCVVADGWLEEMIRVADISSSIGLVNPQSNTFGSVPGSGGTIESHALKLRKNSGRYIEMGHAVGFACLIKREVIDRIGYLDEAYLGVCYEDTDFSARAGEAGFVPVIAEGAYVFHEEQASRKDLPGKEAVYAANKKIFEERWGRLLRVLMLDPGHYGPADVMAYYETLKGFARERALLEVWASDAGKLSEIPRRIKEGMVVGHTDVNIRVFSGKIRMRSVIWRALTKKKKFDAVIVPDGRLVVLRGPLSVLIGSGIMGLGEDLNVYTPDGRRYSLTDPAGLAAGLREKRK